MLPQRVSSPPPRPLERAREASAAGDMSNAEELSASLLLDAVPAPVKPSTIPSAALSRVAPLPVSAVEELTGSLLVDAPAAPVRPSTVPGRSVEELTGSVLLDEVEAAAIAHEAHDVDDAAAPTRAQPPVGESEHEAVTTRALPSSPTGATLVEEDGAATMETPAVRLFEPRATGPTAEDTAPFAPLAAPPEAAAPPEDEVAAADALEALVATTPAFSAADESSSAPLSDADPGETDPFHALGEALAAPSSDDVSSVTASAGSLPPPPLADLVAPESVRPPPPEPERPSAAPSGRVSGVPEDAPQTSPSQPPMSEVSTDSRARILSPWAVRFATRPRWLTPGTMAAGAAVFGTLALMIVTVAVRSGSAHYAESARAVPQSPPHEMLTRTESAEPVLRPAQPVAPPAPAVTAEPPPTACAVRAPSRRIASKALLGSDVTVVPGEGGFAIGFAVSANEGRAVLVLADEDKPLRNAVTRSTATIRHVTPLLTGKGITASVDTEKSRAKTLVSALSPTDVPLDLSVRDGSLTVAVRGTKTASSLWLLPGDGPIEAAHVAAMPTDPSRFVLTFRVGASVYVGSVEHAGEPFVPRGELAHFESGSGQVGAPVVAVGGDIAVAMWADRVSADAPWNLRYSRFRVGDPPSAARPLPTPPGGHGDQAMSPGIAGLPGGRFLVAWTDGVRPEHQVRAQTYQADMSPVGAPLVLSVEGVNAGQAAVGVAPNGDGMVAFLATNESGYALDSVALACGLR